MSEEPGARPDPRIGAALWNIRIDAATAEVVAAFAAIGLESIVLKGPALSDWYPEHSARTYVDGDIWIAPETEPKATEVLVALGFAPYVDERGLPDWWQEHASSWTRQADRGSIDLHRKLQGVRGDDALAWRRLFADSERFEVAGRKARRLSPAGRALYITLHAAHDGVAGVKAQTHLDLALSAADEEVWTAAKALAVELDALDAFSAGLRLTDAGCEMADRLELPANRSVEAAIRAATAPPVALGIEQVASARGFQRLAIPLRKFFPPPGFIRHWWPPAARGPAMLAIGYLYRPLWLLQRAPAGYRAWRAARHAVRRD